MSNEGKRWKSRRRIRCEDKVLGNAKEEYAWDGEEDWIIGQEKGLTDQKNKIISNKSFETVEQFKYLETTLTN
jgi:hypothetical protein